MANYLRIQNSKENIVIDDQYVAPTFLIKFSISDWMVNPYSTSSSPYLPYAYMRWAYSNVSNYYYTPSEFRDKFGIETTTITNEGDLTMVFARNSTSSPCWVLFSISIATASYTIADGRTINIGDVNVLVRAFTDDNTSNVTATLYTMNTRLQSNLGRIVYDSTGKVLFDAMRGVITNIGILSGPVNLNNDVAATYSIPIPQGLNPNHIFISQRSCFPTRSAYKIRSRGVSYSWSKYVPVMSFSNDMLTVRLTRQNNLGGSNSASNVGGFFENVIYCQYPSITLN